MDALAKQLCDVGRRAYARRLISGSEGNLSCRLDGERVLCTPTGLCKGRLTPDDLCVVNLTGQRLQGTRPPSSEILLHLAVYADAPDVRAVIHTHPPYATTFAILGETVPRGILPEAEILLGPVPLVEYRTPGTPDIGAATRPFVRDHVAAILQNHGAVTWGPDLETAFMRAETLEAVCRVVYHARQIGHPHSLASDQLRELAAIRQRLRGGDDSSRQDAGPPA